MARLDFSKVLAKLDTIPAGFEGKVAQVGWFETAKYEDGTPVAYVAAIQEFGSPTQGIPPRPFIVPAIKSDGDAWAKTLADGAMQVMAGHAKADDVLELVGAKAVGDIQHSIESVNSPALSPVTVLLRKWRRQGMAISGKTVGQAAVELKKNPSAANGQNADPLRDTGLLIATVQSQVGGA